MSVIAGVAKAAGAKVLVGTRPAKRRVFPKRKWKLVVMTLVLGTVFAIVALIATSEAPNAEHSSAVSPNSQSQTKGRFPSLGRRLR